MLAWLEPGCIAGAYERSGYGLQDGQLIELHDAFTIAELVYYEALGLVPEGEGVKLLMDESTVGFTRVYQLSPPRSKRYRQVQRPEAYPGLATRSGLLHRPGAAGESWVACSVARAA